MSSSPSPILGFGIVGTGMIAGYHAQAIAALRGARLVGVASRSRESAAAFAAKHELDWSGTLPELLARPDINVVCITTPSGAHLEPALAAIATGKHVVIEKPIEITPARIDTLLAAAAQAGVRVAPIFQARFGPGARTVKAAVAAGRLGRLALASVYVKWFRTAAYYSGWKGTRDLDGGGVVINQAIHGLDLLQWFAGLPDEVFAWKTRRVHTAIESEDTAAATWRFPSGALGAFEASTAAWPGWTRRIELNGETGAICLEDDRIVRWEFTTPLSGDDAVRQGSGDNSIRSGASSPTAISTAGHEAQLQDFVDALYAGRAPALDGAEGRKAVALVHAIYTSAASGQPARVS